MLGLPCCVGFSHEKFSKKGLVACARKSTFNFNCDDAVCLLTVPATEAPRRPSEENKNK